MTDQQTSTPRDQAGDGDRPLIDVRNLTKHFPVKLGIFQHGGLVVKAVDDISFSLKKGETLGIVGESGCGKSTTARLLMHLIELDSGNILLDGQAVGGKEGLAVNELRRQVQMVFQDSYSSLNPRLPIQDTIAFGPTVHGVSQQEARQRALSLLESVGLQPDQFGRRYPHELSGGQRQRINVARALALQPRVIILDEAVSALDKSVEAQVLNLLVDLKTEFDLTYIFISHDLNVVQYMSDRVLVMYLGKVVELGTVDEIYDNPRHPYTQALLQSRPSMDPEQRIHEAPITGDPPNPINPPSGCRFHTRCPFAEDVCATKEPPLYTKSGVDVADHAVACHIEEASSGHSKAQPRSGDT